MYSVIVGVVAADGAVGVPLDGDLVEGGVERVEEQQLPGQRVAGAEDQLQRLVRLERADDPGEDAEHATLGAARCELGRRRGREETAVARPFAGVEHRDLALEPVDRAVHDRDVVPDRRVVDEVPGREVVGAVDDHVPAVTEDPLDVLGGQPLLERDDLHVGVERLERPLRREHLGLAEPVGGVHDLALQVRVVDDVGVDDAERARRRRPRGRATRASRAHRRRSAGRERRAASADPARRPRGSGRDASSACAGPGSATAGSTKS